MTQPLKQSLYETEAKAARDWWKYHGPPDENDTANSSRGDRAGFARLRRADNVLESAVEPATINLFRSVGFNRTFACRDLPRAALIAGVLATVRENDRTTKVGRAIGLPRGGDATTALITPLRFKRIVTAREPDDLLIAFRRMVAIMGRKANVTDLARILLSFTDPSKERADLARTLFAFDYHDADNVAPDQNPQDQ